MKRFTWTSVLIASVVVLASCSTEPPPSALAYAGDYESATVLVTVISADSFVEYTVNCFGTAAEIKGTDLLNAEDACASLSSTAVQERLFEGRSSGRLCSEKVSETGEMQFLGVVGTTQINTFVDREDSCGRSEWDNLFAHLAIPAETDD